MSILFTEEQTKKGLHVVELEELIFYASAITDTENEKQFVLYGTAIIDGERYNGLLLEFELMEAPKEKTVEFIMQAEWEWYDYTF